MALPSRQTPHRRRLRRSRAGRAVGCLLLLRTGRAPPRPGHVERALRHRPGGRPAAAVRLPGLLRRRVGVPVVQGRLRAPSNPPPGWRLARGPPARVTDAFSFAAFAGVGSGERYRTTANVRTNPRMTAGTAVRCAKILPG